MKFKILKENLLESNSAKDNQDARMKRWVASHSQNFKNCSGSIAHHMVYDNHIKNNFDKSYDEIQKKNCIYISNCDGTAKIIHGLFEYCENHSLSLEICAIISLLPNHVFIVNDNDVVEELSIVDAIKYQESFRIKKGIYDI